MARKNDQKDQPQSRQNSQQPLGQDLQDIGPGESQADPQGDARHAEEVQNLNRQIPTQSPNATATGGGGDRNHDSTRIDK